MFSDADLSPLQLQVPGDEVVVGVVVVHDPGGAGVGHVVHRVRGHHHLLLHHHPCHGQEQQETGRQKNSFFSEIFEFGVLSSHSQISGPSRVGIGMTITVMTTAFERVLSVSEIWEKVIKRFFISW